MLFAVFFAFWRFLQIITLIPTVGLLGYFVNYYNNANQLTPVSILVLFIVSVIALAWAIFTLFSYHRSSTNAQFVALVDLLFVGAFIGAVYALRFIADADCTHVSSGSPLFSASGSFGSISVNGVDVNINKTCAMLKASFAFGILNTIFFFFTSVLACLHGDRMGSGDRKKTSYVRETHYHRHGHRSSRSPHSRHSHQSRHSHRSSYV